MKGVDILIIGAGIHGAGTAQAAAAAGFSTLLIEQYPTPAQGTSSRSSKLIHGGLRYLESGRLGLVHESLQEQLLLLKNAPELVRRTPFHLPVYESGRRPAWMIRAGLMLYQLLGGEGFKSLPPKEWPELDGLRTEGVRQIFRYWDAQSDDALLTRAVLASAESLGAEILYSTLFESAERSAEGYIVRYRRGDASEEVTTRLLINAAGPWANLLLPQIRPEPPRLPVELVAGTHIVLPGRLTRGVYYLESPSDGRAIFAMPWRDRTLVGTTETPYAGDPGNVAPLDGEIYYLLDIYNHYFERKAARSEVVESFAGLRVLPAGSSSPFRRSRETVLYPDDAANPRLFTIYGGKLTGYRATAERLIDRIRPLLPDRESIADTRRLPLPVPQQTQTP